MIEIVEIHCHQYSKKGDISFPRKRNLNRVRYVNGNMKKNYKLVEDNYYSSIEETDDPVDNYNVFKTLAQAKKVMIANMKQEIANFKRAIKRIKTITQNDLYGKTNE